MSDEAQAIIASAGHAQRVASAAEALVWTLGADSRVQRAYADWKAAHGLRGVLVSTRPDGTMLRVALLGPPVYPEVCPADEGAMRHAIFRDKERDLALLEQLVSNDLQLPYSWLPVALLSDFLATFKGEMTGEPLTRLVIEPPDVAGLPRGRQPKGGPAYIWRDVEWFYRAEIKQPPDTVYSIAKEHSTAQKSADIWHSTVQNAIARIKGLLSLLEAGETSI